MRILAVIIAVVGVLGAAALGGYWYLGRSLAAADPVPQGVHEAEAALAMPETVGLLHFNVAHAVEVERSLLGEEDREALFAPIADGGNVLAMLMREGVELRDAVQHMIGALVLSESGAGLVAVALGEFPVARIVELLPRHYGIEEVEIESEPVLILTRRDPDSCTLSPPVALALSPNRLVMGSRETLAPLLRRLKAGAASDLPLEQWRAYREGKMLALGLFRPPLEVGEKSGHPLVAMTAKSMAEGFDQVIHGFAGLGIETQPPGLVLDARIAAEEEAWGKELVTEFAAWREELNAETQENLPSLARLKDYLSLQAEGRELVFTATLGKEFMQDLAQIPAELLSLAFGGSGLRQVAQTPSAAEQVVPDDQITRYHREVNAGALPAFDPDRERNWPVQAQSGPFGLRIVGLRLARPKGTEAPEADEELIEIELETVSGELHNMENESMHRDKQGGRAQLFVTAVRDGAGNDLLRREDCGQARNALGGELTPSPRTHFVGSDIVSIQAVSGKKAVRLAPGTELNDVAAIEGRIALRLPSRTEVVRLNVPLAGQVVEAPDLRLRLSEGSPGTLSYEISGQSDRVLAVRALNARGQYLRGAGSFGSGRLLGSAKSVQKSYQGEIATAEFVIAREEETLSYDFQLAPVAMAFKHWDYPKAYKVAAADPKDLKRAAAGLDLAGACDAPRAETALDPFRLCIKSFDGRWGGLQGRFDLLAPNAPGLVGNLSALEIAIESVTPAGGAATPVSLRRFAKLSEVYGKPHLGDTLWVNGEKPETLGDGPIEALEGQLTLRLPRKLARLSLDSTRLGTQASHANGLKARLVGFADGSLELEIAGPRERIVQFVPLDANGQALATNSERLEQGEAPGAWRASLAVSGRPASLEIVFAGEVETRDYPFSLRLGE